MGGTLPRLTTVLFLVVFAAFWLSGRIHADDVPKPPVKDSDKAGAAPSDASVKGTGLAKLSQRLLDAAAKGDAADIRKSLRAGADIECRDRNLGATPLAWAAFLGHTRAVKELLRRGADVNAVNKKKWTPLMLACAKKHTAVVKALLRKGADIDARSVEGWTALAIAFSKKDLKLISVLMAQCSKRPWAETIVTQPAAKGSCAAVRSEPFQDSRKLRCLKPGRKLSLTGIWTKSGWAQMSRPTPGWIFGEQIEVKKLPPRKRVVLDVKKPQRKPQQRRRSSQPRRRPRGEPDDGFIYDPDLYPEVPQRRSGWH